MPYVLTYGRVSSHLITPKKSINLLKYGESISLRYANGKKFRIRRMVTAANIYCLTRGHNYSIMGTTVTKIATRAKLPLLPAVRSASHNKSPSPTLDPRRRRQSSATTPDTQTMTTPTTSKSIYKPSKDDTVHFDPTSIGLPKGWALTDWSTLKG